MLETAVLCDVRTTENNGISKVNTIFIWKLVWDKTWGGIAGPRVRVRRLHSPTSPHIIYQPWKCK